MRNYMKNLITILTMLTVVSCGRQNKNESVDTTFNFPIILKPSTTDTIEYFKADFITHSWAMFAGKSKFCDTLKLSNRRDRDTTYKRDFIDERIGWRSDSLRTDGFELFSDYKSTVSRIGYDDRKGKYFYPVYVVNQTPTTKVFIGKDNYVFAIQEALDTNQNWRPIEGRGFDFCGNGDWGLKIHPKEFLTFLMPKYQGNYKTKIRVRIKIGDIIYVSNPFDGTIDEKQFYLDKKDNYYYRRLVENKANAIQHLFYGAEPLETQDKNFGLHVAWTE